MQIVIPFKGGPLDGKWTRQIEPMLYEVDGGLYKLQTAGPCKMPVGYQYQGHAELIRLTELRGAPVAQDGPITQSPSGSTPGPATKRICDDPEHCTFSDCPTAFCDRA